jgi:hypothetical protein
LTTTAEFKTILTPYTPVRISLKEIDRRRGKMSRSEFSSAILEAGQSDEEKIIIVTSVALSGTKLPTRNPRAASKRTTTTTPRTEGDGASND